MGKGDRKSRKGKQWRGSYGKRRPRPGKKAKKQAREKKAREKQSR